MASEIDALLGLNESSMINDPAYMQSLADKLRGQRELGASLSLSTIPQVSTLGASKYNAVDTNASNIGTRRQQLKRAAEAQAARAESRRLAEAKRAEEKQQLSGDVMSYVDPKSDEVKHYKTDYMGNLVPLDEIAGMTEYTAPTAGGSRKAYSVNATKDSYGTPTITDQNTGQRTFLDGSPYSLEESQNRAVAVKDLDREYDSKDGKNKGTGIDGFEITPEVIQDISSQLNDSQQALKTLISAVDSGANLGSLWDKISGTWTDATALAQSAKNKLGLKGIGKYKLAPWSNKDIEIAMSSEVPNLSSRESRRWAKWQLDAINRYQQAQNIVLQGLDALGREPTQADMERLKAESQTAYEGFNPEFRLSNNSGVTSALVDAARSGTPPAVIQYIRGAHPSYSGMSDAEIKERFNALSEEKRQQILNQAGVQ